MFTRRAFLAAAFASLPCVLQAGSLRLSRLPAAFARLEEINGGRLGVAVIYTATGERAAYRAAERFPMCSTFKFLLASAVLQRVDHAQESLDRRVTIPARPLLANSPLTEPHAGGTMTISELCRAALARSDNTAANLLLAAVGGPQGVTDFARQIGDAVTRLDRMELALNESADGDPRDTTSPTAMAGNLRAVLLGTVLTPPLRNQLTGWMESNLTGLDRLRKDLPEGWRAADKTGSNGGHTSNDIAVMWPKGRQPVIIAAYITLCPGPEEKRATMLADIGRLVRESVS